MLAGASGPRLSRGALEVGLSVRAIGFGAALRALAPVAPQPEANRLLYSRPSLDEWYVNGPLGLEQGFTLRRLPAHAAGATLSLAIALPGNARATLARNGRSVSLRDGARAGLSYGGLVATDARGRALPSWLRVRHGEILLGVDTRGARLPISIDPTVEEESETLPGEETEGGKTGVSVAISGDGNTTLVGAPNGSRAGMAWVFTRAGSDWDQQGPGLTFALPGGAQEALFGSSVALSNSGDIALIGAPHANEGQGAAWVFERSGGEWKALQELTAPASSAPGHFGRSVALSADGGVALVGAPAQVNDHGQVWAFMRTGPSWVRQAAPLTAVGESGPGFFGRGLALSASGETALVGAPGDSERLGAAWSFRRSGSSWSEQSKLTGAGESAEGRFGFSVALSGDGATALIGAPEYGPEGEGAAWTFTGSSSGWTEQPEKLTLGESEAQFGFSVDLSSDGSRALIGAPRSEPPNGTAQEFTRTSGAWSKAQLFSEPPPSGRGRFGAAVALSEDGNTALVGAPSEANNPGTAWVFDSGRSVETLASGPIVGSIQPREGPAAGGTSVTISGVDFSGAEAVQFGTHAAASFTVNSATSITAVSPPGTGSVDVTVTRAGATSATRSLDRFKYLSAKAASAGEEQGTTGLASGVPSGGVLAFAPTSGCGIALRSRRIAVISHSRALVALLGVGAGRCSGSLRLTVTRRAGKHRVLTRTIGVAGFSIFLGRSVSVKLKLNARGRALLRAGHGRLLASIVIVRSSPAPRLAKAASVRLTRQTSTRRPLAKT